MIERSGDMTLATTVALAVLRGPVPLAKALAAIDLLSDGRLIAAVGPGSSQRDYDALGVPFEERWKRFDEALAVLRALLDGEPLPEARASTPSRRPRARAGPRAAGSRCGSGAGDRRPGSPGWRGRPTAGSPLPTTRRRSVRRRPRSPGPRSRGPGPRSGRVPERARHDVDLGREGSRRGRARAADVLAPVLRRDPDELRGQVCVGPAEHCAELLSRYAEAGCQRVFLWPLGDEQRQLELIAGEVAPKVVAPSNPPATPP